MPRVRYKCCAHCVWPCPANGHTTKCDKCSPTANGRRAWKPPEHLRVVK